jgi:hypothetical protein
MTHRAREFILVQAESMRVSGSMLSWARGGSTYMARFGRHHACPSVEFPSVILFWLFLPPKKKKTQRSSHLVVAA